MIAMIMWRKREKGKRTRTQNATTKDLSLRNGLMDLMRQGEMVELQVKVKEIRKLTTSPTAPNLLPRNATIESTDMFVRILCTLVEAQNESRSIGEEGLEAPLGSDIGLRTRRSLDDPDPATLLWTELMIMSRHPMMMTPP
jgi:hypothetical protein